MVTFSALFLISNLIHNYCFFKFLYSRSILKGLPKVAFGKVEKDLVGELQKSFVLAQLILKEQDLPGLFHLNQMPRVQR